MQLWGKTSEVQGKKQNLISADTEGHFGRSRPCNQPNDSRWGLQSRCLWTAGWGLGGRPALVKSQACFSPFTSFSTTVLNTEGTHPGTHIVLETKQADTDFSLWVFGWTPIQGHTDPSHLHREVTRCPGSWDARARGK